MIAEQKDCGPRDALRQCAMSALEDQAPGRGVPVRRPHKTNPTYSFFDRVLPRRGVEDNPRIVTEPDPSVPIPPGKVFFRGKWTSILLPENYVS